MALRSLPGEVPGSVAGAVDLGLGSGIPVMRAGGAGGLIGGRGGGGWLGWGASHLQGEQEQRVLSVSPVRRSPEVDL